MNKNKINGRGQIQQSHMLNGDCSFDFVNRSCFDFKQTWNMGACSSPLAMATGPEQPPYIGPSAKSSSTITSGFESPASASYATERYIGFPQYDFQVGNLSLGSQFPKMNDLEFPLYQSPRENLFLDSARSQADPNYEISNTLQAIVKSQLNSNQYCKSLEKSNKIPCGNLTGNKFLPIEQHKLFIDGAASVKRNLSIPFKGNRDHSLSFSFQQEKPSPILSAGSVSNTSGNHATIGAVVSSKARIRWTQDLHEKFVECVNRLGGAEKATPKAILKLMGSDGLTIFHVKSHLQKYRIAKYMPDPAQGKSEKRTRIEDGIHLDGKTGLQIREALQLQLDVQRRLHEQLEIQRKLQLRIEEQGKQLKMMFDRQQKACNELLNDQNFSTAPNDDTPISLKDVQVSISEGIGNISSLLR